jgi:hypothetical protein
MDRYPHIAQRNNAARGTFPHLRSSNRARLLLSGTLPFTSERIVVVLDMRNCAMKNSGAGTVKQCAAFDQLKNKTILELSFSR